MDFLKKRLIGAVFVLSLTIIFVPAILDGSGNTNASAYQTTLTQQLASVEPAANKLSLRPVNYNNARAWAVRVGAFSNSNTALTLQQRLQDQGYVTYVQALPDSNLYGVFVGPELVAQNAEIVRAQLQEQLDLNGTIVPHDPILYVQNS